jgi:prepilin-type N-terminal cleavage/methylation domain-containing protein
MRRGRGFTLIELLIVVAIIAILALIAVPNFLEAQTRSKVVRVRTDFRNLLTAMEAYHIDYNAYPPDMPGSGGLAGSSWYADFLPLTRLTTPVAYIHNVPTNPFFDIRQSQSGQPSYHTGRGNYAYWGNDRHPWIEDGHKIWWHIISCGPDLVNDLGGESQLNADVVFNRRPVFINALYDPTNGTISRGDLHLCARGLTF